MATAISTGATRRAPSRSIGIAALLLALACWSAPARAETIVIDTSAAGASYDGIVDGFPGIAALDGVADVAGNALGVGLKSGVTEERGIVELPLAPLGGVSSGSVSSAILTFNIDDVLATFGPGTDFDGTASDPIHVAIYSGNGAAELSDFGSGTHVATVSTGGASITDASLADSGPVEFDVDVTQALRDLLDGGATYIGIVFSTDDNPTGTSIDDLGIGSSGPPGVNGAFLPFLTVEASGVGPTPTPGGPTPVATPRPTPSPTTVDALFTQAPHGTGDQLVFYYDARDSYTTFLNIRNLSGSELTVGLVFLSGNLDAPFEDVQVLPAGGTRTIDVGGLRGTGLPARFGIALVSAVDGSGLPIVSRALEGNFTVANLATGSAWGGAAPARVAYEFAGGGLAAPDAGEVIDGDAVVLHNIRPDALSLSVYYNPDTLEPAEIGGNQVIFVSFTDQLGDPFAPTPQETTWEVDVWRNDGQSIEANPVSVGGVEVSDLETLAGSGVNGAAGSMRFTAHPPGAYNRMVFFTESLGTFAAGYLLPHVAP